MKRKRRVIRYIFPILLLAIVTGLIMIYEASVGGMKGKKEEAAEQVLRETDIESVDKVDWFHYEDHYYVVYGKTEEGEKMIAWVPEKETGEIVVKRADEGLSEEEAIELLQHGLKDFSDGKRPKEIIRIKLGMVEYFPVYEITYRDRQDRYSFIYIDFYKGEWYRVYHL